jgi:glycosyltransferase involved in cell wall biosynthesis
MNAMERENRLKVLAIYHDLDMVIGKTLEAVEALGGVDITVAAPAGARVAADGLRRVEIAEIGSKLSPRAVVSIRRAIRLTGADIVLSVSTSALSNALLASTGLKVKHIGYRGTQARVRRLDPTYRMALLNPRVDHIICETADIEEYLRGFIPAARLSTKTKPYDLSWVGDALEGGMPLPGAGLKLLFVGASAGRPHKGLGYLLEAMRLLGDDVSLTVIGKASEADMASAPGNVAFLGHRSDAVRFMPGADLLVVPSTRDASPRVVREAQACGTACLVSDIAGARDLIVDRGADALHATGMLVAPASAEAIAEAVNALKGDRAELERMGRNGRENIEKNYRLEDYARYYRELFRRLG